LAELDNVPEPWYYRKLPPSLIAIAATVIVAAFLGIEFWPQRLAAPLTVVATAPLPQPERSPLPTNLKPFLAAPESRPVKTRPLLPPPPALQALDFSKAATAVDALSRAQAGQNAQAQLAETAVVAGSVH